MYEILESFERAVLEENEIDSTKPMIVTSTSWTKDEDFGMLYDALKIYDDLDNAIPMTMVITGKGPEKEFYQRRIKKDNWKNVEFRMPWLLAEHYSRVKSAMCS